MSIQRLPDWPERLAAYMAAMRPRRYVLGQHDCAQFAAGAVQAVTGRNVLLAQWRDVSEALQVLRAQRGLRAAVDAVLPRLAVPALAQRGDVVLVQAAVGGGRARRQWLAVADGARWWCPAVTGLESGPAELAVVAWGVGHG